MRKRPVREQVVVLVGASSGIGRGAALAFAGSGARVVAVARGDDDLASLVDAIERRGGTVIAVRGDASELEDMQRVARIAVGTFGRIDTWVHLAAVSLFATFEDTTPEELEQVLRVNVVGQANGAWAALPELRRSRGTLVHVTSVEAERALPYQSAYAASKHAVSAMVDAMRLELNRDGARVDVVDLMPATVATPLFEKARTKIGVRPRGMPPTYDPDETVAAILEVAERPRRRVAVGRGGRLLIALDALAPRLADAFLGATAFRGQRTSERKRADAPDNLEGPLPGYDRVRGRAPRSGSGRTLTAVTALAAMALLARSAAERREQRGDDARHGSGSEEDRSTSRRDAEAERAART